MQEDLGAASKLSIVGKDIPRVDGLAKATVGALVLLFVLSVLLFSCTPKMPPN